ncbi:fatty acid desaturase [Aliishimia ponticola]|uniref:Fatty acid desaturase n=1 Tax=Aliishimia ponticola TaxID=2499833 RepID=A0A4V3XKI5_9RHOB|nr:fatty acid desaturase [Aliishimia ponticola]THH37043.1 fatty acid desaturase [Aliishimia ponticola]
MSDPREVRRASARFCDKNDALAVFSLGATFLIYVLSLGTAAYLGATSLWTLPLIVIAAGAMIRLYVLQHDFGHLSFFTSPRANEWAGHAVSVFTLAPFRAMQYNHNLHHAGVGSLDHRETGEVYTMTLEEWQNAPAWKRAAYRAYRNPVIMLALGAFLIFVFRYRWPKNATRAGRAQIILHNAAMLAFGAGLVWLFGWAALWVLAATIFLAGIVGSFLVYLQHNFEDTYWEHQGSRSFAQAALMGSSQLDLGHWFDIITANINWHDLHHINPQIPSYRLRKCHAALRREGVLEARLIGWRDAMASLRLKLWDEEAKRLVPFPRERESSTAQDTATA